MKKRFILAGAVAAALVMGCDVGDPTEPDPTWTVEYSPLPSPPEEAPDIDKPKVKKTQGPRTRNTRR